MMDGEDLNGLPQSVQDRVNRITGNNFTPADEQSPGFLSGAITAPLKGIAHAASSVAEDAAEWADAYGALTSPSQPDVVQAVSQQHQEVINSIRNSTNDAYRPDPKTTGFVGNLLYGVADTLPRLAIPEIGVPLAASTLGFERKKDLQAAGVDDATATTEGLLAGGEFAAMGSIAGLGGSSMLARLGLGAGANVGLGIGTRALDSAILRKAGYEDQARQQDWMDGASIASDALIGMGAGLVGGHKSGEALRAPPADVRDAALAIKNAENVQSVAPGIPADANSATAHLDALDTATAQMLDGQPVDVDSIVKGANFVPRPDSVEDTQALEGFKREAATEEQSQLSIGEVLRRRWESDFDAVDSEYNSLAGEFDSNGGRILNTDIARELSPDYVADRTRSADVHDSASDFIKEKYRRMLAQPTPEGADPVVLFTAGGTGAGKTTGEKALRANGHIGSPEIVYDTNMNGLKSSNTKIQQALDAGRKVRVLYTFRDPVDALVNGALKRAERMAKDHGSGRTVPISEHAKTHLGAYRTIKALSEKYEGNPRVDFRYVDNSRGKGNELIVRHFDELPKLEEYGSHEALDVRQPRTDVEGPANASGPLEGQLRAALDAERDAGHISDATYQGFASKGREAGHSQGVIGGSLDDERGVDPRLDTPSLNPSENELIDVAEKAARDRSSETILDADGNAQTVADAMRQADEEVRESRSLSKAIKAAAQCFLRYGE